MGILHQGIMFDMHGALEFRNVTYVSENDDTASCYLTFATWFQDVSSKIMAFSQNGPRTVCILSANGAVSNVTLRQAATSGGTATYEVLFVRSFSPFAINLLYF